MDRQNEFDGILARYFEGATWQIETGASGMNNTTRYVRVGDDRYVLRVYETHRDADKVEYEHHILDALRDAADHTSPYAVPHLVHARDGKTLVHTMDGKLAALFRYREGSNPILRSPADFHDFGRAAGRVSIALSQLKPQREPLYRPYYELGLPTPEETRETLIQPCLTPDSGLSDMADALEIVQHDLSRLHEVVPLLQGLPHQLIHGDLNASNVLAGSDNRIRAILDFEFVAWDLRVMELAVCLSEAMPEPGVRSGGNPSPESCAQVDETPWEHIAALIHGFTEIVPLTREEANILPQLVQLRRLDVFVHFLNRWKNGVDSLENVRTFLSLAAAQHYWIAQNGKRLISLVGK